MANKPKTNIGELAGYESSAVIPDFQPEPTKQVVEHITKTESVVSIDDVAASKRRNDAQAMKKMINGMRKLLIESPRVKFKPSPGYASIFGTTWTFLLNGFPITVEFNGKEQEFPLPVYERIMEKINEGMEANAPKDINEKLR